MRNGEDRRDATGLAVLFVTDDGNETFDILKIFPGEKLPLGFETTHRGGIFVKRNQLGI